MEIRGRNIQVFPIFSQFYPLFIWQRHFSTITGKQTAEEQLIRENFLSRKSGKYLEKKIDKMQLIKKTKEAEEIKAKLEAAGAKVELK